MQTARADYGVDAPGIIRGMAFLAMGLIGIGVIVRTMGYFGPSGLRTSQSILWPGFSFAFTALFMYLSSRFGKLRARDRMLDRLRIQPSDSVLDVGCGHGLMLLGAAKRVSAGHAIGVDIWSQKDQHANSAEATLANAVIEGVRDRVTVKQGDMRQLPLDSDSIDVVVSCLAIHNVPSSTDRALAIREIIRVLRPGGRVGILDIAHVGSYARELKSHGLTIAHSGFTPWIFPPTRELIAQKSR